jgi:hypothetical protein
MHIQTDTNGQPWYLTHQRLINVILLAEHFNRILNMAKLHFSFFYPLIRLCFKNLLSATAFLNLQKEYNRIMYFYFKLMYFKNVIVLCTRDISVNLLIPTSEKTKSRKRRWRMMLKKENIQCVPKVALPRRKE